MSRLKKQPVCRFGWHRWFEQGGWNLCCLCCLFWGEKGSQWIRFVSTDPLGDLRDGCEQQLGKLGTSLRDPFLSPLNTNQVPLSWSSFEGSCWMDVISSKPHKCLYISSRVAASFSKQAACTNPSLSCWSQSCLLPLLLERAKGAF